MGNRGLKPKGKVNIKWSANFAYVIGLLATDGCLSDGRHIIMTSKDIEQLKNFNKCLKIDVKFSKKNNGRGQSAWVVQFGDVLFYKFLENIGLTKAKSLTLGKIDTPDKYFFDFLRGCFDGDGCSYSYWDPRWKSSFMFYVTFASGSKKFIEWLQQEIYKRLKTVSHIAVSNNKINKYYQLKYAKKSGLEVIKKMYYSSHVVCLNRKRVKIEKSLVIDRRQKKV